VKNNEVGITRWWNIEGIGSNAMVTLTSESVEREKKLMGGCVLSSVKPYSS
jgi:hypothetical protein